MWELRGVCLHKGAGGKSTFSVQAMQVGDHAPLRESKRSLPAGSWTKGGSAEVPALKLQELLRKALSLLFPLATLT